MRTIDTRDIRARATGAGIPYESLMDLIGLTSVVEDQRREVMSVIAEFTAAAFSLSGKAPSEAQAYASAATIVKKRLWIPTPYEE